MLFPISPISLISIETEYKQVGFSICMQLDRFPCGFFEQLKAFRMPLGNSVQFGKIAAYPTVAVFYIGTLPAKQSGIGVDLVNYFRHPFLSSEAFIREGFCLIEPDLSALIHLVQGCQIYTRSHSAVANCDLNIQHVWIAEDEVMDAGLLFFGIRFNCALEVVNIGKVVQEKQTAMLSEIRFAVYDRYGPIGTL